MTDYIKDATGRYARTARKGYNELVQPLSPLTTFECRAKVQSYFGNGTLYPVLSNIVYGYIIPELEKIDDIRLSIWVKNYGMDAAVSTIPLKFGPIGRSGSRYRLDASGNHICDGWGYQLWYTRFLEKSGEKYEVMLVQQLGGCISRNMQLVKKCIDFAIKLSMDVGTQCNVDNIRNCLIEAMYKHLPISMDSTIYKNKNGVIFDLKQFRITVKSHCTTLYHTTSHYNLLYHITLYHTTLQTYQIAQETQHIVIRLDDIGAFKRKCGDYRIIKDTFQKIMNACHLKWNILKSPPVLHRSRKGQYNLMTVSPNQYHPYELFFKSKYLHQPKYFKIIQTFVLAFWQTHNTTNPVLIAELLKAQQSDELTRAEIIDQFRWCIQNSAARFQLCWPSVEFLFSLFHLYYIIYFQFIQMFFVGIKQWFLIKMKYPIYNNVKDEKQGQVSIIDIPYWKCSHHCYLDLCLLTQCDPKDYPYQIGPYPCPLAWVSYMDSTLQLRSHNIISYHIIIHYITSHYIISHHIIMHYITLHYIISHYMVFI